MAEGRQQNDRNLPSGTVWLNDEDAALVVTDRAASANVGDALAGRRTVLGNLRALENIVGGVGGAVPLVRKVLRLKGRKIPGAMGKRPVVLDSCEQTSLASTDPLWGSYSLQLCSRGRRSSFSRGRIGWRIPWLPSCWARLRALGAAAFVGRKLAIRYAKIT